MPVRKANAIWKGDLKSGNGFVKGESGNIEAEYSFPSRFETGSGTNPEELIGAAHAGCYSMALANGLSKAGFTPNKVETTASVHLEKVGEGFKITKIELDIGPLSGVEADLLRNAYPIAAAGTIAEDAELVIRGTDIVVRCMSCKAETDATPNRLVCGNCGNFRTRIVSGDEMILKSLEIEA